MSNHDLFSVNGQMDFLRSSISAIRNIRNETNIQLNKKIDVIVETTDGIIFELVWANKQYYETLAGVKNIEITTNAKRPPFSASLVIQGVVFFVLLEGLIDIETEKNRLQKEVIRLENLLEKLNNKLVDQIFLNKAPKEIINKERKKKRDYEEDLKKIKNNFNLLFK